MGVSNEMTTLKTPSAEPGTSSQPVPKSRIPDQRSRTDGGTERQTFKDSLFKLDSFTAVPLEGKSFKDV